MAGTVTVAEQTHRTLKRIKWSWISASGVADKATTATFTGEVKTLVTDPGAAAPDDNYDITITDADGIDVLAGAGANRDTANTEYVLAASLGGCVDSVLTLNVTNAGDAKAGDVYLYIR